MTGHVGGKNNSEKVFWKFDSICCHGKPELRFPIVLAPTWPSYHVSAIKESKPSQEVHTRILKLQSYKTLFLSLPFSFSSKAPVQCTFNNPRLMLVYVICFQIFSTCNAVGPIWVDFHIPD